VRARTKNAPASPSRLRLLWRRVADRIGVWKISPLMLATLAAAILFVGLFYVWTRMQLVQIGYEISTLETKGNDLKNRKRELQLEVASLQSPKELEVKASKYGLTMPAIDKVVHVP
jgi:cell division protein FtsL